MSQSNPVRLLSVIIVNWNTQQLLAASLRAIEASTAAFDPTTVEIIVVDNGSHDGSAWMVRTAFPWVHLIENQANAGFARANNQAIRRSTGRYVLLLNSDCLLNAAALIAMLAELGREPTVGIAGVCLAFPDGAPQFCQGEFPTLWREFKSLFGMHRWDLSAWGRLVTSRPVDWVSGACLLARRTMLDQIGLLDERTFMFGEEVDLCLRCHRAGWQVRLTPAPPVVHIRAGSTGKSSARILRLYRGKIYYARKHLGPVRTVVLRAMILASSLGKLAFYSGAACFSPQVAPQRALWREVLSRLFSEGRNGNV